MGTGRRGAAARDAGAVTRLPEGLTGVDEGRHRPDEDRRWGESWSFELATPDGTLGGYVRLGISPQRGSCWYWASLVGERRRLVTVIEHDVRPPRPPSLELRAEGLWADHNIEVPFDHLTLGCEAFALALDDPAEVYGPMRGERVPFGLDLEWETDGAAYLCPPGHPSGGTRYELPCRVHGEILVGDERIELDAVGQRHHAWGVEDWGRGWMSSSGWLDDGTRFHATTAPPYAAVMPQGDEPLAYAAGYVQQPGGGTGTPPEPDAIRNAGYVRPPGGDALSGPSPGGTPPEPDAIQTAVRTGETGFPAGADVVVGDLRLEVTPVALAPVLVAAADGRRSHLVRALCRYRVPADGRSGVGWTDWNRPQS